MKWFNKTLTASLVIFGTFTFSGIAYATAEQEAQKISVSNPYAREVPPNAMASASFMMLKNSSDKDIYLIEADSTVAKTVQLHTHVNDNGVMRMRQVPNIKIPAHGMTKLQPGGYHIMLIGLKQPLVSGHQIQVTLTFKDGSHKIVEMPVKSVMGMQMQHHSM